MTGLRCLLTSLTWNGSNITGLKIMAMKASREVGCALRFCTGSVQAPVAVAVLPAPEATSAVPTSRHSSPGGHQIWKYTSGSWALTCCSCIVKFTRAVQRRRTPRWREEHVFSLTKVWVRTLHGGVSDRKCNKTVITSKEVYPFYTVVWIYYLNIFTECKYIRTHCIHKVEGMWNSLWIDKTSNNWMRVQCDKSHMDF